VQLLEYTWYYVITYIRIPGTVQNILILMDICNSGPQHMSWFHYMCLQLTRNLHVVRVGSQCRNIDPEDCSSMFFRNVAIDIPELGFDIHRTVHCDIFL